MEVEGPVLRTVFDLAFLFSERREGAPKPTHNLSIGCSFGKFSNSNERPKLHQCCIHCILLDGRHSHFPSKRHSYSLLNHFIGLRPIVCQCVFELFMILVCQLVKFPCTTREAQAPIAHQDHYCPSDSLFFCGLWSRHKLVRRPPWSYSGRGFDWVPGNTKFYRQGPKSHSHFAFAPLEDAKRKDHSMALSQAWLIPPSCPCLFHRGEVLS